MNEQVWSFGGMILTVEKPK